jgi:hypothetical protein
MDPDPEGVKFVFPISFQTNLFVSVVSVKSIRIRNTETNRKIYFLFRYTSKINRNILSFGLFQFKTNIF